VTERLANDSSKHVGTRVYCWACSRCWDAWRDEWPEGRPCPYCESAETFHATEHQALRAVVRQVAKGVTPGNGHVHLFDTAEVGSVICCPPAQVAAVRRVLGEAKTIAMAADDLTYWRGENIGSERER
jgi:hypothetical protein